MTVRLSLPVLALLVALAGCDSESVEEFRSHGHAHGHSNGHSNGHGCDELDISDLLTSYDEDTNDYANPDMWLSGPDAADDIILSANLDTTIVYPDLSTEVIHPERAQDPDLDIFYIYPTVDLNFEAPGNSDLSDLTGAKYITTVQAARFSTLGRVIAPVYHQGNVACFLAGGEVLEGCLETAYADIEDAFEYYLANHWNGRKLVLMGHSQGSILTRMLVERMVDDHPELRSRIAVVMPLGGDLEQDSFDSMPACAEPEQTGCYVSYLSYYEGTEPLAGSTVGEWAARSSATCTDVSESGVYEMSYFRLPGQADGFPAFEALTELPIEIDTPFFAFPERYTGNCVNDEGAHMEIGLADVDDQRWEPLNFAHPFLSTDAPFSLGLHLYDYDLAMGDLLELVEEKAGQLEGNEEFCVAQ